MPAFRKFPYIHWTFLLAISFPAAGARAESAAHSMALMLAPLAVGVVRGRDGAELKDEAKKQWDSTVMVSVPGKGTCSGFVIGDCVITAAHCVEIGKDHYISTGTDGDSHLAVTRRLAVAPKEEGSPDLAVIKMGAKTPEGVGYTRAVIPKDAPSFDDPKQRKIGSLFGYGANKIGLVPVFAEGTKDVIDAKTKVEGGGEKRHGSTALISMTDTDGKPLINVEGREGDPDAPNAPLEGDSGGPLIYQGKLHGIAASRRFTLRIAADGKNTQINGGHYTPVARYSEWITKQLDRLSCETNFTAKSKAAEVNTEIVRFVNSSVAGADKDGTMARMMFMPEAQQKYIRQLVAARIEAQTGAAPKDIEKLKVMLDFTDTDRPYFTANHIRLMLADPANRRRVFSVVVKTSVDGKPEDLVKITPG
jgi:hypothetical protein